MCSASEYSEQRSCPARRLLCALVGAVSGVPQLPILEQPLRRCERREPGTLRMGLERATIVNDNEIAIVRSNRGAAARVVVCDAGWPTLCKHTIRSAVVPQSFGIEL